MNMTVTNKNTPQSQLTLIVRRPSFFSSHEVLNDDDILFLELSWASIRFIVTIYLNLEDFLFKNVTTYFARLLLSICSNLYATCIISLSSRAVIGYRKTYTYNVSR